jgi:GNAT superfamily N-acetyltransferase
MSADAHETDDDAHSSRAAHAALVSEGALEPLSRDPAETRLWLDCELASLVENRFFVPLDPLGLTPATRALWEPRATSDEPLSSPHGHDWYRRVYWMRDGGERAGTFALATGYMGPRLVTVSSLYTFPSHRRRGVAARALRRAQTAVVAHGGAGLRVPTYWTWQPAVRFYLGLGMWVLHWKDSPVFFWRDGVPPHRIEIGADTARFGVEEDGRVSPLIAASRAGDRLAWQEAPHPDARGYHARQTFAMALATHGFPLIRSADAWEARHRSAEGGEPEGLACRIEAWEAWEQRSGYEVRTPRIPGLAYRAWDDIT